MENNDPIICETINYFIAPFYWYLQKRWFIKEHTYTHAHELNKCLRGLSNLSCIVALTQTMDIDMLEKITLKIVFNWVIISVSAKGCHYIIIFPYSHKNKVWGIRRKRREMTQNCFVFVLSLSPNKNHHSFSFEFHFVDEMTISLWRHLVVWCSPFHAWLDFV